MLRREPTADRRSAVKTMTLAVPTVGGTPRLGAGLSWQLSSAPTGLYGLGTGLPGVAGVVDCAAATHGTTVAITAPVARAAADVDVAALPFVAFMAAAATSTKATPVAAVAGNQQVAVAPKQAEKPNASSNTLVNFMRENAFPRGYRVGAPPS